MRDGMVRDGMMAASAARRRIFRRLVPFAAVLALSACAAPPDPPPAPQVAADAGRVVAFACADGTPLTVTFLADGARLGVLPLAQLPAGSGIRYQGSGHALRGKGSALAWTDPDGVVRPCEERSVMAGSGTELAGTAWRLIAFQPADAAAGTVVPPRVERYEFHFGQDGALALRLDCNRAMARYVAQDGTLAVTAGAMTRAHCGPEAIDTRIAGDLAALRAYRLAGGELRLLRADGGSYRFEPLAGPAE